MRIQNEVSPKGQGRPRGRTTAAIVACLAGAAAADDLHVPSQYPTIAAAVAASSAGDHIVLANGVYEGEENRQISLPSHPLTIRSASGVASDCVIDIAVVAGDIWDRAFLFTPESSSETVISSVTITRAGGLDTGGAIRIEGSSPTISGCVFVDNWAFALCGTTYGGAISLHDSDATLKDCVFTDNFAGADGCMGTSEGYGGAVYVSGGSPTITGCEFDENRASAGEFVSAGGGALFATDGAEVTVRDSRFSGNSAYGGYLVRGGALLAENATINAVNCLLEENQSIGEGIWTPNICIGGAAFAGEGGRLNFTNCRLIKNSAPPAGWGGLAGGGGAIALDGGAATIVNSVLAENHAALSLECGLGGAVYLTGGGSLVIQSSTIANNTAGCDGGAIYVVNSEPVTITNSIIWGNGASAIIGPGEFDVRFSDVEGGWPGEGNIDADPLLDGDYRLAAGSPAADAGANDLVPPDTFDLDGDGDTTEPLPLDLAGSARFADDAAAPDTGRGTPPIVDMGAYETSGDFCYADCDGSGELDFFDFLCFQNLFAAGAPEADCDGSGELDFFDFLCFQNEFAAGCD